MEVDSPGKVAIWRAAMRPSATITVAACYFLFLNFYLKSCEASSHGLFSVHDRRTTMP